jgi:adenosine kinase
VTDLRSAEKFEQSHLSSPAVARLVDAARVFYVEGYFLTHGLQSILEISKKASDASKVIKFLSVISTPILNTRDCQVFAINLSAPFIPGFGFEADDPLFSKVVPYCDIIIGNEDEAKAWATAKKLPADADLKAIAKALATEPKSNPSRPRHVIFTQGSKETTLVSSAEPDSPKVYPVNKIDNIVDTNGAGDAFAGGFLGAFVAGKSINECVEAGHKLGAMCVQQVRLKVACTFWSDTKFTIF